MNASRPSPPQLVEDDTRFWLLLGLGLIWVDMLTYPLRVRRFGRRLARDADRSAAAGQARRE